MIFRVAVFGMAGSLGGLLGVWSIDRDSPVEIQKAVTEVRDNQLIVAYQVNRRRDCPSKIDRWIVDTEGTRWTLPDIDWARAPGPMGIQEYKVRVDLPQKMAFGSAVYHTIASYKCNPIHLWFYPVTATFSVPFLLLPK